jgi:hypothetical protein
MHVESSQQKESPTLFEELRRLSPKVTGGARWHASGSLPGWSYPCQTQPPDRHGHFHCAPL